MEISFVASIVFTTLRVFDFVIPPSFASRKRGHCVAEIIQGCRRNNDEPVAHGEYNNAVS